ncbi:UNVERIFIED_CONTAM: hypothetical protein FKN15_066949 [Acipenser sinensis]
MAALSSQFGDLVEIKKQLTVIIALCRERGLMHSVKWASELAFALDPLPMKELPAPPPFTEEDAQDLDAYSLAKSFFDLKEYDRAAYFLRGCRSQKAYFLYMYSRYLSGEKKKDDETVDSLDSIGIHCNLLRLLLLLVSSDQIHSDVLYAVYEFAGLLRNISDVEAPWRKGRYGVVLRKLDLLKEAIDVFVEATHCLPLHWGAWLELCNLVENKEMLKSMSFPDTWMKDFFLAHIYTEMQMIEEALQKYQSLINVGFSKSTYIISQIAVAYQYYIISGIPAIRFHWDSKSSYPVQIQHSTIWINKCHKGSSDSIVTVPKQPT